MRLSKKYNSKSKRYRKKTNKRKLRKTYRKKSRGMFRGGGKWVSACSGSYEDCPICDMDFSKTPEKAIYRLTCGHCVHNNCLNDLCENNLGYASCPICGEAIRAYECADVNAFKRNNNHIYKS